MIKSALFHSIGFVLALCLPISGAAAADFPTKPIHLIVPYTPGGPTDITARVVSEKVTAYVRQPVIIENRPGAGGRIGMTALARSPADGYTIGLGTSSITSAPFAQDDLPWKPTDFAAVSMVVDVPLIFVVNSSLSYMSINDVIAAARREPGKLTYSTSGIGTVTHLGVEWLKMLKGVDIVHAPYPGATESIRDVVAGRVQMTFDSVAGLLPFVKDGKLRAIAVASLKRIPSMPSLPTVAESGLPDYEVSAWFGILAPPKTPSELVKALNVEVAKAVREPDVQKRFVSLGMEPVGSSSEEFSALINRYFNQWLKVTKSAGLQAK